MYFTGKFLPAGTFDNIIYIFHEGVSKLTLDFYESQFLIQEFFLNPMIKKLRIGYTVYDIPKTGS